MISNQHQPLFTRIVACYVIARPFMVTKTLVSVVVRMLKVL